MVGVSDPLCCPFATHHNSPTMRIATRNVKSVKARGHLLSDGCARTGGGWTESATGSVHLMAISLDGRTADHSHVPAGRLKDRGGLATPSGPNGGWWKRWKNIGTGRDWDLTPNDES